MPLLLHKGHGHLSEGQGGMYLHRPEEGREEREKEGEKAGSYTASPPRHLALVPWLHGWALNTCWVPGNVL